MAKRGKRPKRVQKPKAKRSKPRIRIRKAEPKRREKRLDETFTTSELLERYGVSQRTLRRWSRDRGFPQGEGSGRHEYVYSVRAVYEWEKIHMPHLHPEDLDAAQKQIEQEDEWSDLSAVLKGDEARERIESRRLAQLPPKPRRKK